MPKKTFKDSTAHLDRFFSEPQETHETHETQMPHGTYSTHKTQNAADSVSSQKHYRLNLKLKIEHKEYLEHVSWAAKKSVTQYLNELIEADKDARNML